MTCRQVINQSLLRKSREEGSKEEVGKDIPPPSDDPRDPASPLRLKKLSAFGLPRPSSASSE